MNDGIPPVTVLSAVGWLLRRHPDAEWWMARKPGSPWLVLEISGHSYGVLLESGQVYDTSGDEPVPLTTLEIDPD